jgi:transcriptional regulator with XRE-family HTH domain
MNPRLGPGDKPGMSGRCEDSRVASTERLIDVASRRARTIVRSLGEELHNARLDRGLSQLCVGKAAGVSQARVSRIERGDLEAVSLRDMARLLSVVGLELSARAYASGRPVRDEAHRVLLEKLRAGSASTLRWRFETPIPLLGDQRAWDATISSADRWRVAVEAETRLRDIQALQRRVALKQRDDPSVQCVVLLVAGTRSNRDLLRDHLEALREQFPATQPQVLRTLSEGRSPGENGIVLL